MRRCAFSTNNNTTGTSDLTAPSRGRLFLTSVRHRRIAPHSAIRRPARRTSFGRGRSNPAAGDKRQVSQEKRSLCLHPDLTAGGPHRPPKRSAHGDRPCPDRRPPASDPAYRSARNRNTAASGRSGASSRFSAPPPTYGFPAGCGGACDDARRKRIGRIPARHGTGQKRAEEYSSSARSDPAGTTHSLGSI